MLNEFFDNYDLMGFFGIDIMVDWFKVVVKGVLGVLLYFNDYSNYDFIVDKEYSLYFFKVVKFF